MKPSRPSLLSEFYQKDFNNQENGDLNNDSDSSDDEDFVCESSETGFLICFFILLAIIFDNKIKKIQDNSKTSDSDSENDSNEETVRNETDASSNENGLDSSFDSDKIKKSKFKIV